MGLQRNLKMNCLVLMMNFLAIVFRVVDICSNMLLIFAPICWTYLLQILCGPKPSVTRAPNELLDVQIYLTYLLRYIDQVYWTYFLEYI